MGTSYPTPVSQGCDPLSVRSPPMPSELAPLRETSCDAMLGAITSSTSWLLFSPAACESLGTREIFVAVGGLVKIVGWLWCAPVLPVGRRGEGLQKRSQRLCKIIANRSLGVDPIFEGL